MTNNYLTILQIPNVAMKSPLQNPALNRFVTDILPLARNHNYPLILIFMTVILDDTTSDTSEPWTGVPDFADSIQAAIRSDDFFCEIDHNNFVLVLAGVDQEAAWRIAERLHRRITAKAIWSNPKEHRVNPSIGLCEWTEQFASAGDWFEATRKQQKLYGHHSGVSQ